MALAALDPRIKCVKLPHNVGVGGARNAALAHATGTWITILDADDWYEPKRVEALLAAATAQNADLIADNLKIYDHVRKQVVTQTQHGDGKGPTPLTARMFFDGDNPLRRHPTGFIQPLMRRKFIEDNKIVYDQTHRVGEDFLFVASLLLCGARAFVIPEAYYVYVHRISPTTRKISPNSHSSVAAVFSLMVRGCNELLEKYGARMDEETRRALLRRRWILERASLYQDMRAYIRHRRFLPALRIAITQPVVFVLIGNIVMGVLAANMRLLFHSSNNAR
jgi:succinoglycan biosynthesis protein ExoO